MGRAVLDLREVADGILGRAKELLASEGYIDPVGIVIRMTGETDVVVLDTSSKEASRDSMRELWDLARKVRAIAVFKIADRIFREFEKEEQAEVDVLKAGLKSIDWDGDPKVRCAIVMEIMVPGEFPTKVLVPYSRRGIGSLEFDEPMEGAEDRDVNRFGFWGREAAVQN